MEVVVTSWYESHPDWFHIVELNEQQRAAFDWVKSKGGRLGCDDSKPNRPIVSLDRYKIGGSGVRDQGLKHLAAFPELRKLNIGVSDPTAEGLREVAKRSKCGSADRDGERVHQ